MQKTLFIEIKQIPPSAEERQNTMFRKMLIVFALFLQGCAGGHDLRAGYFYGPTFSAYENGVIKGQLEMRQRQVDEMRNNTYRKAELCRESRHIGPGGWFSGSSDCIPSNPTERPLLEQAARDGDANVTAQRRYNQQRQWDNEVERGRSSVPIPR